MSIPVFISVMIVAAFFAAVMLYHLFRKKG